MALAALVAKAQPAAGTFSLIPRVGVSVATISNYDTYCTTEDGEVKLSPKYKGNFTAGLDGEYKATNLLSVSLGVHYAMLGCRFADHSETSSDKPGQGWGYTHYSTKIGTVQVPLLLNAYVAENFAVKVGVQFGFMTNAKESYEETPFTTSKDGAHEYGDVEKHTNDVKDAFKTFSMAVPVGVSYEYANVVLDARYNLGVTKTSTLLDTKNHYFSFTVGYRFAL